MFHQGLNGSLVVESAEIDVVSPVRIHAEKLLIRERGDFYRLVGRNPVHIGDLRVMLQQDIQDRGVDESIVLLCQVRQGPAFFHNDRFLRFDCPGRLRLLLIDLCLIRDGLFDNGCRDRFFHDGYRGHSYGPASKP